MAYSRYRPTRTEALPASSPRQAPLALSMMSVHRDERFPIGASISVDALTDSPYEVLDQLRAEEPVSWVPATGAWFVTRRDLAIEAMVDAVRYTVDDDRFTTARVLGTSMLNLDGPEHERHRRAFVKPFRPKFVREELEARIVDRAARLVAASLEGPRELRTGVAGPLAVDTILDVLGLHEVAVDDVLSWYGAFGTAITALTVGEEVPDEIHSTLAQLYDYVGGAMGRDDAGLITQLVDEQVLTAEEIPAAVAVVMFGAIETSEGMTTNAFWHLFTNPEVLDRLRADRSLLPHVIDESLRLEPAAAWLDRYTTEDVVLGGTEIPASELVTINLLAANRDPEVFDEPATFNIDRPNRTQHVTWAQGPHTCLGLHVAKAETAAAITALLDAEAADRTRFEIDKTQSSPPTGLIFRKPESLVLG